MIMHKKGSREGPGGWSTKQEYAVTVLREAIVTGQLTPGQRLRQEEVARDLGLSWTPVREALRQLETEGWLIIERHRGAVVTPLSLQDFEDIYVVRLAVEPLAARLGAERADEGTIREMDRIRSRMLQMTIRTTDDWDTFLELEREYGSTLYRASRQPRLYDLVMSHRIAAGRYLRVSFAVGDEPTWHLRGQTAILEACRRRDGKRAEFIMRRALERVRNRMRPILATRSSVVKSLSDTEREVKRL
jgi:DNA-binding GntR family transcriptional regulator